MKKSVIVIISISLYFLFSVTFCGGAAPVTYNHIENVSSPSKVCASEGEMELYNKISEYRADNELKKIPYSKSLTYVAQVHAMDLFSNHPDLKSACSAKSWSSKSIRGIKWTIFCCFDGSNPRCMWAKPREIAGFDTHGFEMVFKMSPKVNSENTFEYWTEKKEYSDMLLSKGKFKGMQWNSLGLTLYKNYAVAWFASKSDFANVEVCKKSTSGRRR